MNDEKNCPSVGINTPGGSNCKVGGGKNGECIEATTSGNIALASKGPTSLGSVGGMLLQTSGAGGFVANGGLKLLSADGVKCSGGTVVQVWAGAGGAASLNPDGTPAEGPKEVKGAPCANVAKEVTKANAFNTGMKTALDAIQLLQGVKGLTESLGTGATKLDKLAKAAEWVGFGGGLLGFAGDFDKTVQESRGEDGKNILSSLGGKVKDGAEGVQGVAKGLGGEGGVLGGVVKILKLVDGEMTKADEEAYKEEGGTETLANKVGEARTKARRQALRASKTARAWEGVKELSEQEGDPRMLGRAAAEGAAGSKAKAAGAAGSATIDGLSGSTKVDIQGPAGVEMTAKAHIKGTSLGPIEFKTATNMSCDANSSFSTTSKFNTATGLVTASLVGGAIANVTSPGIVSVGGGARVYVKANGKIGMKAPTIEVNGKGSVTIESAALVKVKAPKLEVTGDIFGKETKIQALKVEEKTELKGGAEVEGGSLVAKAGAMVKSRFKARDTVLLG